MQPDMLLSDVLWQSLNTSAAFSEHMRTTYRAYIHKTVPVVQP